MWKLAWKVELSWRVPASDRTRTVRLLQFLRYGVHLAKVAADSFLRAHSIKAIQAQLGHKLAKSTHQYAHLGQRAQLRLVADLEPCEPPHFQVRSTSEKR